MSACVEPEIGIPAIGWSAVLVAPSQLGGRHVGSGYQLGELPGESAAQRPGAPYLEGVPALSDAGSGYSRVAADEAQPRIALGDVTPTKAVV